MLGVLRQNPCRAQNLKSQWLTHSKSKVSAVRGQEKMKMQDKREKNPPELVTRPLTGTKHLT